MPEYYACQAVLTTKRNAAAESDATGNNGVQSIGINGDIQSLLDIDGHQDGFTTMVNKILK